MDDQIEDPIIQSQYIRRILELKRKDKQDSQTSEPQSIGSYYNIKNILKRFKQEKPITVQDLQIEL